MFHMTMRLVAALLLTATYFTCTAAEFATAGDQKRLRYLLESPVYAEVAAIRGASVTLPCILKSKLARYKVKWTKVEPLHAGVQNVILITNGLAHKTYGPLGPRASLRRAHALDASLRIRNVQLEDDGQYRCELIDGIEEESITIMLAMQGVVFPYQSSKGRYKFTYQEAKEVCKGQDGVLATFQQLYKVSYPVAWTAGLEWCNAGWLSDGTVHYPILQPREPCGGEHLLPGIRSYGPKDESQETYDAFCFTSEPQGYVFFLEGRLSFGEALQACRDKRAELARVGQLYSAWHFQQLDICTGGWLVDGSVRYPINRPRERCGGTAYPGVRSFGFPSKSQHHYGAYCFHQGGKI